MAGDNFKPGDVVRLKSGGPKMTVVNFGKYGYGTREEYKCKWFDDKHNLVENTFSEEELESAQQGTSVPSGPTRQSPWS